MEGGFAAGDEDDSGRAQRELPDLETEFAGKLWEGVELRGRFCRGFHVGGEGLKGMSVNWSAMGRSEGIINLEGRKASPETGK